MAIGTPIGSIERNYDAGTRTGRVIVRIDVAALAAAGLCSLVATHLLHRVSRRP